MQPTVVEPDVVHGKKLRHAIEPPGTWTSTVARIASVAVTQPQAIALRAGGAEMTYAALLSATSARAGELVELGIGADRAVGVCLPRSFAHVVAFLGVLQAGAAVLPIDPGWPRARIGAVLEDAGATVVITCNSSPF